MKSTWPRYKNIQKPAIIISGNEDNVVFPYIHSSGLACHIKNSELIELQNLGHKPDHIATDIAVAAVKKLAKISNETDLQAMAQQKDIELADQRINCGAISAL